MINNIPNVIIPNIVNTKLLKSSVFILYVLFVTLLIRRIEIKELILN